MYDPGNQADPSSSRPRSAPARRTLAVAAALVVLGGCTPPNTALPEESLTLHPDVVEGQDHASHVNLTLVVDGERVPVELDTGSIYMFLQAPGDLTCPDPSTFTWGSGSARFCERTAPLDVVATDGSVVEVHPALKMGEAKFSSGFPPIIGFSANMQGRNIGGLEPVIDQLKPRVLSFRFPDGPMHDGVAQFSSLPADSLRGVIPVPLVDPGSLEYGYTSNISRVDFIVKDTIKASIITEPNGVYLEAMRCARCDSRLEEADEGCPGFDDDAVFPHRWQAVMKTSLSQAEAIAWDSDREFPAMLSPQGIGIVCSLCGSTWEAAKSHCPEQRLVFDHQHQGQEPRPAL